MSQTPTQPILRHKRQTSFAARGEPKVWLMGLSIVLCVSMIVLMIVLIVARGSTTFWPRPIHEVTLADGTVFLGVPMGENAYQPMDAERAEIEAAREAGVVQIEGAWDEDGQPIRRRYMVGNRDLGQQSFRWVPLWRVREVSVPLDAVLVERREWGVFLGRIESITRDETVAIDDGRMESRRAVLAEGTQAVTEQLNQMMRDVRRRQGDIARLNERVVPGLQSKIRNLEWSKRAAAIEHDRTLMPQKWHVGIGLWSVGLAGLFASMIGLVVHARRTGAGERGVGVKSLRLAVWLVVLGLAGFCWLERPGSQPSMSASELARVETSVASEIESLRAEQRVAMSELEVLRSEDSRFRIVLREPTRGRISAISQSEPNEPMLLSQVVRIVQANELSTVQKWGVYFSRWWEFLSDSPRDGTAAGGVFPVIVGTVTLTMLLTICVVPLGVIAALYLREYSRQGVLTSVIRIAVNNLAGVPSIVYGMFGLGFFCYSLGVFVDGGPRHAMPVVSWWMIGVVLLIAMTLAATLGVMGKRIPGSEPTRGMRIASVVSITCWCGAIGVAFWMISTTPYFNGFFEEKLPETPTFGGRGILWASLTLALLTLPVVIVATEEAIAAVPGSMREGSYGCGASKWQTMRHIVLPSAMPGILTGAILAMARGAGEVAPLMLVGAVNLAPALPVSGEAPFLHGDRTFMHLGFHIYTLGFQSPDSEAAEPLVWTTTLLLLSIVLLLNLVAIVIRARLRARMRTSHV
ncbi:MAG: ABC transporter permease subunit [Phycisphaeraceae bacterium]|nr:ABC transporter permease subunit [Phycisphaeraceae bacterium]MCW5764122.1 ABC transporter permease subunit [Phycisphaeraceae bacterium]